MPLWITPGVVIGDRYRIDGWLGEGGMGVVWRAFDLKQQRGVALKALHPFNASDDDLRRRLLREARALRALRHPAIVQLLDVLELQDEAPILVFELLEGETLAAKLERERHIRLRELVGVVLPLLGALSEAHASIVHRDLKPENIFLCSTSARHFPSPKILDFGLVKKARKSVNTRDVLGTLLFMSPEAFNFDLEVDARADIYALGVLIYLCLSGEYPTTARHLGHLMSQILNGKLRRLRELAPAVPSDVEELVMRMLSFNREDRPSLLDIEQALSPHAPSIGEPMPLRISPGIVIDSRYRVDGRLGEGGMGVVWRAFDLKQNRGVALKALRPLDVFDEKMRLRMLREAQALRALHHPAIVKLLEVLELPDEAPILVFELLEGETLAVKLERELRIALPELVGIVSPILGGLWEAHSRGVIHRDLKPENIFLCSQGLLPSRMSAAQTAFPKILDFGIVKLLPKREGLTEGTLTGSSRIGTLPFMSPEALKNETEVDDRTDIYGLGVVIYLCLSGELPTTGETVPKILVQIISGALRPLREAAPWVPSDVEEVIMHMLSRNREDRPSLLDIQRTLIPHALSIE
jgi:serine/threonine-protein kinase